VPALRAALGTERGVSEPEGIPMSQRASRTRVLRSSLLLGTAFFGISAPAAAQDQAVETVVVTGSRIPQQGLYSTSPVTAVGQQEMKFEGTTNVEQLIDNLPIASADFNLVSSAFSGALGTANVDLRGLGQTRTLVLIDGRRLMPGDPILPVADVNVIPASIVDHVEVLTGGASAVYGSDAIAGVVNFITRKDFEGIEIDGQWSGDNAPNDGKTHGSTLCSLQQANGYKCAPQDWWGGYTQDATILMGVNSPNGKGNITVWAGYRNVEPIAGFERDFSNCAMASSVYTRGVVDGLDCAGSSNFNRWISIDNAFFGGPVDLFEEGTGAPGSGHFVPYQGLNSQKFNFGAPAYFQQPSVRYTGGYNAHYQIDPMLDVYSSFMFMDNRDKTVVSPTAVFLGAGPAFFPGTHSPGYVQVNCFNPLMTAQENQTLCGMAAGDALVAFPGHPGQFRWNGAGNLTPGQSLLVIGRRLVEDCHSTNPTFICKGGRVYDTRHTSYRIVLGTKGDLGSGWTYDVYGQYGETVYSNEISHDFSKRRVENALNVDPVTGQCESVVNASDTSCVPLDIFNGLGSITPDMLKYSGATGFVVGNLEEQVVSGNITGDLGQWGIQSPWAKNPVALSLGSEWRAEYIEFDADYENLSNDIYGGVTTLNAVPRSGFQVAEGFGEIRIPVIQNLPWVEDLTFNGGYRYSSYSSVGAVHSYKYGAEWQVTDDVRFRASYQRAVRAPNVLETFAPNAIVLVSAQDPCNNSTAGQCAFVTNAGTGRLGCPSGQCNREAGGNLNLTPEISDTKSLGAVVTPTFLPAWAGNLTATVDYFAIKIDQYISTIGAQNTLNNCYSPTATAAQVAFFCPFVHRSITGTIYGAGYVDDRNLNLTWIKTKGVDFEMNDTWDLDTWGLSGLGSLSTNFIGTLLSQWSDRTTHFSAEFSCQGLFGLTCGSPYPRWRHKWRWTWSSPWDFDFSVDWRHLSHVNFDADTPKLGGTNTCTGRAAGLHGLCDTPDDLIKSFDYIDLAVNWNVSQGIQIHAGVNNVFATNPPIVDQSGFAASPIPFGNDNTFPGTYDSLGRTVFVGATLKY
jgi:iron complex outermembrane recepter protein